MYPISTHWCWGSGGWLVARGFYDFAGSGVVHVSGGIHALIGESKYDTLNLCVPKALHRDM